MFPRVLDSTNLLPCHRIVAKHKPCHPVTFEVSRVIHHLYHPDPLCLVRTRPQNAPVSIANALTYISAHFEFTVSHSGRHLPRCG